MTGGEDKAPFLFIAPIGCDDVGFDTLDALAAHIHAVLAGRRVKLGRLAFLHRSDLLRGNTIPLDVLNADASLGERLGYVWSGFTEDGRPALADALRRTLPQEKAA